ncbi:MAG: cytochrome [Bdellovibrionales bacterium]|nr:cytochrome [Bdellovibrionales bacterium]
MYIQGDLQCVFDALYHLGVIDPVLELDWTNAMESYDRHYSDVNEIIGVVNANQNDVGALMKELKNFDDTTLGYLAMEVAREFAEFHSRDELQ